MSRELRAMGALVEERPDGMVIRGLGRGGENGRLQASSQAQSHGDHRVAMSLAIGGLTAEQGMTIADTGSGTPIRLFLRSQGDQNPWKERKFHTPSRLRKHIDGKSGSGPKS